MNLGSSSLAFRRRSRLFGRKSILRCLCDVVGHARDHTAHHDNGSLQPTLAFRLSRLDVL